MIPQNTVFTKLVNCRTFNYFFQKLGIFQGQMALTTAHVDSKLHLSDTCSLC